MVEKEEGGPGGISEEEAAQYDRQIRLWGLEAQKRLRGSRVLLVGMRGLGAEVAKNLILAGVKGLTLLDPHQVSPEDSRAQFLIPGGSLGRNRAEASLERAQSLNPMVEVRADPQDLDSKPEDFFSQFDAVCLTCCPRETLQRVDEICHRRGVKFFSGDVFGYHGATFSDLGLHHFVEEKPKVAKGSSGLEQGPKRAKVEPSETSMVKRAVSFCRLQEALECSRPQAGRRPPATDYFLLQVLLQFRSATGRDPSPQSFAADSALLLRLRGEVLRGLGLDPALLPEDFGSSCFSELAPVCAVVGGVLGQEVVKALSQRDPPHNNFFFFDGIRGTGVVERMGPA